MARRLTTDVPVEWRGMMAGWCETWGVASLADDLTVTLSSRFRTCLGRCTLGSNEIRVAAFLVDASPELLHEVLCHEAAHAAVFRLFGRSLRPHGLEWGRLMRAAGMKPRAAIPSEELDRQPAAMAQRRVRWEHRCPKCDMHHLAGRPVKTWRCAACRNQGLNGKLLIRRVTGA